MSVISYAQNFEDVLLWRALRHIQRGKYLDIGAQDPVIDSVSLAFYEAGWRGIHVEPTPFYAARLREARPDETIIEAAVTDEVGPLDFHEIADTGLSTGKEEIARRHESAGFQARKILVPCVRLDRLFELVEGDLHWMKVDVEGMEADVLRSWGESRRRPWILVIESTAPNSQKRTEELWIDEVVRRGYEQVFFDGLSSYFLHESQRELADRFDAPANLFDGFSVAPHHFSASRLRMEVDAVEQQRSQAQFEADQLRSQLGEAQGAVEQLRSQVGEAWQEQRSAFERLVLAEENHRAALESHSTLSRETEERLRNVVAEAQAAISSAQIETARLEERSAQLQQRLDRADEACDAAEARAAKHERQIVKLRAALDQSRSEARESAADAKRIVARLEQEREAARVRADESAAEADRLRAVLATADVLIKRAASEPAGTWQRLGEVLRLTRRRESLTALQNWRLPRVEPHSEHQSFEDRAEATPVIHDPAMQLGNPYLRANSLAELLSWNDADFVRCAYVTILGRQPDPEGESYYTDRIRRGHSKMEVLWQLRRSAEGQRHDPGIAGLDRALKIAVLGRKPLIGPAVRLFTKHAPEPVESRVEHTLTNRLNLQDVPDSREQVTVEQLLSFVETR